jgi:hypothetical protein
MSPKSRTHHIAVLVQDNGELAEDVVERELVEQASRRRHRRDGEPTDGGPNDLGPGDRDTDPGTDSFPASDPPSSWSGMDRPREARSERVLASAPVEDVPERPHPAAPIPRTIPRGEGASH